MCSKIYSITDLGQYKLYCLVTELHVSVNDMSIVAQSLQESTAGTSGRFRHVQHVRPNRGPHKKGAPTRGVAIFCNIATCRKQWATPE